MRRFIVMGLGVLLGAATAVAAGRDRVRDSSAPARTAELVEKGRGVYAMSCAMCHGDSGDGQGPAGMVLTPRPRDFAREGFKQGGKPEEIFKTISEGVQGTPMASWQHISEEERWAVTYYVLDLATKRSATK